MIKAKCIPHTAFLRVLKKSFLSILESVVKNLKCGKMWQMKGTKQKLNLKIIFEDLIKGFVLDPTNVYSGLLY